MQMQFRRINKLDREEARASQERWAVGTQRLAKRVHELQIDRSGAPRCLRIPVQHYAPPLRHFSLPHKLPAWYEIGWYGHRADMADRFKTRNKRGFR